mmetsp:Transcript_36105/g.103971  ORF Transcript_36105/g.103971 Transcript_36105/m.103971 type:complete len:455 (-) Transcript_36105:294-1658(-)
MAEVELGARHFGDVTASLAEVLEYPGGEDVHHVGEQRCRVHVHGEVALDLPVLHLDHTLDLLGDAVHADDAQRRAVHLGNGRAPQRRAGVQAHALPPVGPQLLLQCPFDQVVRLRGHRVLQLGQLSVVRLREGRLHGGHLRELHVEPAQVRDGVQDEPRVHAVGHLADGVRALRRRQTRPAHRQEVAHREDADHPRDTDEAPGQRKHPREDAREEPEGDLAGHWQEGEVLRHRDEQVALPPQQGCEERRGEEQDAPAAEVQQLQLLLDLVLQQPLGIVLGRVAGAGDLAQIVLVLSRSGGGESAADQRQRRRRPRGRWRWRRRGAGPTTAAEAAVARGPQVHPRGAAQAEDAAASAAMVPAHEGRREGTAAAGCHASRRGLVRHPTVAAREGAAGGVRGRSSRHAALQGGLVRGELVLQSLQLLHLALNFQLAGGEEPEGRGLPRLGELRQGLL